MQSLLKEQELAFSLEEIEILRVCAAHAMEVDEDGELSEDTLDGVARGRNFYI